MKYHSLLNRQLRRFFGSVEAVPADLMPFIHAVNEGYNQFDKDRKLSDHVLETSSMELTESNRQLRQQNQRNQEILDYLRNTVTLLHSAENHPSGEQDLLGLAQDIEQLVQRRHETELALREAKESADSANRAKSDFLANMSHEIRTPLNAVVGMTSILLDSNLNAEQQDYVETIRHSSDALLDIINDILDFSKIEAGKMEIELIPCDLRSCVEQVVDMFSSRAVESNLDLGMYVQPQVPHWVATDPTRLRQVLVNLVGNALKFTEKGGVGIFVQGIPRENKWEIRFSIEDTGIGIPQNRVNQLFQAFSQVDASTTRKYGGTGLGLAITSRLVALLGGTIEVQSVLGKGSTFSFSIVVEESAAADLPLPRVIDLSSQAGTEVLVVDDIAINRRILQKQLNSWGFKVTLTDGPLEALEKIKTGHRYGLILLDFNMPVMNGAELALEMTKILTTLPPTILLSSRGKQTDQAGPLILRRLTKPVKPTELRLVIGELLSLPDPKLNDHNERIKAAPRHDHLFAQRYPLRILVAEDVAVNRKVIELYLKRLGYRADLVADGQEALDSLSVNSYDLILMDLQMPVLDGLSATRLIRKNPLWQQRPYMVALTANVLIEQQAEAIDAGMQDYLCKPLRAEALADALSRAYEVLHEQADTAEINVSERSKSSNIRCI